MQGEEKGGGGGRDDGPVPEADAEGEGLAVGVAWERVDAPLREPGRRLDARAVGHGPPRRRHRRHHLIDAAQQPQRLPRLLPQVASLHRRSPSSCTAANRQELDQLGPHRRTTTQSRLKLKNSKNSRQGT